MGNKFKFQKLTPIDNADIEVYKEALDFIFDNEDIKNIAISGPYGAGKSSILETYKKNNDNKKFIHISLAHFENPDNEKEGELDIKESILEGKILNQLIHQIPSENIPQTNFKVKKKTNWWAPIILTIESMILVISLAYIIFFSAWSGYVETLSDSWLKLALSLTTTPYSILIVGLVGCIIFGLNLFQLIKAQINNKLFKGVKVNDYEIEIFEKSEESYFDKYLNEVLYLFENSNADAVVFEDVDRFNANRIFERLHEINTLANIQLSKENKPPLRFFYLLRDDIFISKDRTKFFDYILPAVPIVDSSNSYDQFISHFEDGNIKELFNKRFLRGLSNYIDDMRILKNIYNEFIIYYNRLNVTELNANKMLAIITYKNIFPRDFSDLQLNRGMVFNLFDNKQSFIEIEKERIREQIEFKKNEIESSTKEHLLSISELDLVFRDRTYRDNYNRLTEKSKQKYNKRKKIIENKINGNISNLEIEIVKLNNELVKIDNKSLKEIITRDNIDEIFKITYTNEIGIVTEFNEIKGSEYFPLLKYLIRNGYIDETYKDYMTYFYEYSLSRTDKIFLRSITDQKAKDYWYKLQNPELIIEQLHILDFDQVEALNFDLLEYLIKTTQHDEFTIRLFKQLKNTQNHEFTVAFFETSRKTPQYVKKLNTYWPEFFYEAIKKSSMTETQIRKYSILTLLYSNDDNMKLVNIENCLTEYISASDDYLNIEDPEIKTIINAFILLDVSFEGIDIEKSNNELFKEVYKHSLYVINYDNISLMLREFYMIDSRDDIRHRNYSLITSSSNSPLANYVNEQIEGYMEIMLANCDGQICDDVEVVIQVLNNEDISEDKKHQYISYLKTIVSSIRDITDRKLWTPLLENKLVLYSEENIVDYLGNDTSINSVLCTFINNDDSTLNFSSLQDKKGDQKYRQVFEAILTCNELSNKKYKELLRSFSLEYDKFNFTEIPNEKIDILVDLSIISMTTENLLFMRSNYIDNTLYFINKNVIKYTEIITNEIFNYDEALEVISWDVNDELKIEILGYTNEPISIIDQHYSVPVKRYILENNLEPKDPFKLFDIYEQQENEMQGAILELAINKINNIINEVEIASPLLIKDLLETVHLGNRDKFELFLASFSIWDQTEIEYFLNMFELEKFYHIFDRDRRPRFEINPDNERLLEKFKESRLIKDYTEDVKGKTYGITRYPQIKRPKKVLPDHLL